VLGFLKPTTLCFGYNEGEKRGRQRFGGYIAAIHLVEGKQPHDS